MYQSVQAITKYPQTHNSIGFWLVLLCLFGGINSALAQVETDAEVLFNPGTNTISIRQQIHYTNQTGDTLQQFYLNDWANAFKSKESPLAKHFSSTYITRFHYSKLFERGETKLDFVRSAEGSPVVWNRPEVYPDIVEIQLDKPLNPDETLNLNLSYTLRIPDIKFTGFGRNFIGEYNLRYWLMAPAVYDKGWKLYSHAGLRDQYQEPVKVKIHLRIPENYQVFSALNQRDFPGEDVYKNLELTGENRVNFNMALVQYPFFQEIETPYLTLVTDIQDEGTPEGFSGEGIERILRFLGEKLGPYPHKKLLVTEADYANSPMYGLNQLPDFIRPFPDGFHYELKMVKTITREYLHNTLLVNPRTEGWLLDAHQIYLMMEYVNKFYPDIKLIGSLSKVIGIRWTHLADLDFNHQYSFYSMNMNRLNLDQPLRTAADSLVKFNQEIANPYKAGVGFKYLQDYLGTRAFENALKDFYAEYKLKKSNPKNFEEILKRNTDKDVTWFVKEFANTNVRIDFKISHVEQAGDSLKITIKNLEDNTMPVSLYGLKGKKVVSKYWIENTNGLSEVTIPKMNITKLGLNYEGIIPEFNQRNNYKNLRGLLNKPIQFRLLKDAEDPYYTQVFISPEIQYNLYDGVILGSRFSNIAILTKTLSYEVSPQLGLKSRALTGRFSIRYSDQYRNIPLNDVTYGLAGQRFSYNHGLFYNRISPHISFNWRDRDLLKRKTQRLQFRSVSVHRDSSDKIDRVENPNYNIFNVRFSYGNGDMITRFRSSTDLQMSGKFSKLSWTAKYRKLFLNNKQIEFRLFAGMFLHNNNLEGSTYFNFALDRPTDYMFDYQYYGRSEEKGFFSQQFIESEGGFKSKINPGYADQWITSLNSSVSLWRDVLFAYGDFGFVKNHGHSAKAAYDSGIRVSLVQDYFEVYFPVYSSNGWEIGQSHYQQKIRFMIALDFKTLLGIFTRTYY